MSGVCIDSGGKSAIPGVTTGLFGFLCMYPLLLIKTLRHFTHNRPLMNRG
jgi:hypothetical protein